MLRTENEMRVRRMANHNAERHIMDRPIPYKAVGDLTLFRGERKCPPHLGDASFDASVALLLVLISIVGAFFGGYRSSTRISEIALRRLFVVVIFGLSVYKGISLAGANLAHAVGYSACLE